MVLSAFAGAQSHRYTRGAGKERRARVVVQESGRRGSVRSRCSQVSKWKTTPIGRACRDARTPMSLGENARLYRSIVDEGLRRECRCRDGCAPRPCAEHDGLRPDSGKHPRGRPCAEKGRCGGIEPIKTGRDPAESCQRQARQFIA